MDATVLSAIISASIAGLCGVTSGLFGVFIGGSITYFIQRRQREWVLEDLQRQREWTLDDQRREWTREHLYIIGEQTSQLTAFVWDTIQKEERTKDKDRETYSLHWSQLDRARFLIEQNEDLESLYRDWRNTLHELWSEQFDDKHARKTLLDKLTETNRTLQRYLSEQFEKTYNK